MDDVGYIDRLLDYGDIMGRMILDDVYDKAMTVNPEKPQPKLV